MIDAFKKNDLVRSDLGVGIILHRENNSYYVMMLSLDGTICGTRTLDYNELEMEDDPAWIAAYGRLQKRALDTEKAYPPKKVILSYPSDGDFGKIEP